MVFQPMMAKPVTRCPRCKKGRLTRLLGSGSGLIFKGTGFYVTDYKKSGGGSKKKDDAPAPSKPSDKGDKSKGGTK